MKFYDHARNFLGYLRHEKQIEYKVKIAEIMGPSFVAELEDEIRELIRLREEEPEIKHKVNRSSL